MMRQLDVIMIAVSTPVRKDVLATIMSTYPKLKVVEGTRCFSVTEAD